MASNNIRINQQLGQGYNPDGTPGSLTTGVAGPPPSDDQVMMAVSAYMLANPMSNAMSNLMAADPAELGPGSYGASDVVIQVGTRGTKDGYIVAANGADPMNLSGRTPIDLHLAPEAGGRIFLDAGVTVGGQLTASYDNTAGATIGAPDKITLSAPTVSCSHDLQTQGSINAFGSITALGSLTVGQYGGTDPAGFGGFNTVFARNSDGGLYYRSGGAAAVKVASENYVQSYVSSGVSAATLTSTSVVNAATIRLTSTADASATSTGHAFQIGADNTYNTIIDNNEIIFRQAGVITGNVATQQYVQSYVSGFVQSPDGGWTTAGLQNGWQVYSANTAYAVPRFRKLSNGQTEVQGLTTNGTIGTDVAVFTLPAGYRPGKRLMFATIGNNLLARVDVNTNGVVSIVVGSSTAFTSLHFSFTAEL